MAKLTLKEVHGQAIREFDTIQSALRNERELCLQDRRFYSISGAQWEGDLGDQFENKPKFEVNKIHLSVIRIINEYRNNRITVDFIPKNGELKNKKLADTCDGLYRADEEDSCAQEAYDNAFEEAVGGGIGAWRLTTCYEDEEDDENEYQRIRFEPIYDADSSVYFDLNAKRQDKSDAKHAFVITAIPRDIYIAEYDDDPASWPKEVEETEYDWESPDVVYICEYYRCEYRDETVIVFRHLDGSEERFRESEINEDPQIYGELISIGAVEDRKKKIKVKQVHKYILNGARIMEDCGIIAGNNIPIVPVYGKRWFIDNVERCMGHVRLAKDPQRLKNMQLSKLGEISALSSVEKPIFTPEQILGHRQEWRDDNIENYPFLLVNPITDQNGNTSVSGPVGYTKPPAVPPAMAALLQLTETDMQDLLGNQQAAEKVVSNISGKAIELIQNKLDMQTYIYMSNMAKAVKRSGEIWLSMAKDIMVEPQRKMKVLDRQNEVGSVELIKPTLEPETGELIYDNDLSEAKFDIKVSVGPSTTSKRAALVRELTGMMQMVQDPETLAVLSSMALMNMEGEGLEEVQQYFRRKLVQMGVLEPNEKEMQELQAQMQNQQTPAEEQYLQAAATESIAKAEKARADTIYTVARAEETKAKTAETLADIDSKQKKQVVDTLKEIRNLQTQPATIPPRQ